MYRLGGSFIVATVLFMSCVPNGISLANHAVRPEIERYTLPPAQLITDNATELVLTIMDFEPGWVQHSAEPSNEEGAVSAYHVYYYDGSVLPLSPPVIQNTTAVYPSIELAQQVYSNEVPKNVSVGNPQIGDECFLDISIPIQKRLVFRKSNVVVWLRLQQDTLGDVKPYARILDKRIGQELQPDTVAKPEVPPPKTTQMPTSSQPVPPEPTSGMNPFIILLLILLGIGFYFLPSMLAIMRHKRNVPMILVVNFFTAWTVIGWCITFAWSLTRDK